MAIGGNVEIKGSGLEFWKKVVKIERTTKAHNKASQIDAFSVAWLMRFSYASATPINYKGALAGGVTYRKDESEDS